MTEANSVWAGLSAPQKQVVSWGDGPLIVIAGPGSGKTRVLTCRLARLLQESPGKSFRILAITFTNRAADEMRDRIEKLCPEHEKRLFVGTFHAFCTEVLRQNGSVVNVRSDFRIYSTEKDRQDILLRAIGRSGVRGDSALGLDPTKLLPVIDRFKSELVSSEQLEERIESSERAEIVAKVFHAYDALLQESNALDFNSLLTKTYELFSRFPAVAARYQTTYKYWCIDELQDTNRVQFELLRAMAAPSFRNIMAVADDDQLIYQWNGASYARLDEFSQTLSPELIQLPTNYRCPPEVVELANRLVRHNVLRRADKQPLEAAKSAIGAKEASPVVRVLTFPDQDKEARGLALDIKEQRNRRPGSIAVLARTKSLLEGLLDRLQSLNVPAQIAQRRDEFVSSEFVWMLAILRLANRPNDADLLKIVASKFSGIAEIECDVPSLIAEAKSRDLDLLRMWVAAMKTEVAEGPWRSLVSAVESQLIRGSRYLNFCNEAVRMFDSVNDLSEEAFSQYAEDRGAWAAIYKELRRTLEPDADLEVILQELDLRSKEPPLKAGMVALMTIHAAKGNEFDLVYLMGMAEDVLPSFQSKKRGSASPEVEEERRNCFVAITRASEALVLSRAEQYRGWRKEPSRFLKEMGLM